MSTFVTIKFNPISPSTPNLKARYPETEPTIDRRRLIQVHFVEMKQNKSLRQIAAGTNVGKKHNKGKMKTSKFSCCPPIIPIFAP